MAAVPQLSPSVFQVVGMILLNTFGHRLCLQTLDRPAWSDKATSMQGNCVQQRLSLV